MIKDQVFKNLFIPVLGLFIPMATNFVDFHQPNKWLLIASIGYFICVTSVIWYGTIKLMAWLRRWKYVKYSIFTKLALLLVVTTVSGFGVSFGASWLWQLFAFKQVVLSTLIHIGTVYGVCVFVLTLIYEIIFLSTEATLDAKVLQQLDNDRVQAEINILQNELDPHFLFNCLNALSYLVKHNQEKATLLIQKLSNVFKYFLCNKLKDFVPLSEEIEFLNDYYFLLRVRFEDSVRLDSTIDHPIQQVHILPCTLQALVENAIKHNYFSEKEPLQISIRMNKYYITVSNPIRPKLHVAESTKTGLYNLKNRYWLIMNKRIVIQANSNEFLVQIPLHQSIA